MSNNLQNEPQYILKREMAIALKENNAERVAEIEEELSRRISATTGRRPKRLWVICAMNILSSVAGIATLLVLLGDSEFQQEYPFGIETIIFGLALPSLLIITSSLAFFRIRYSRPAMMASAVLLYGVLAAQNAYFLYQFSELSDSSNSARFIARTIRGVLEIGLNWWALYSAKSNAYFRELSNPPNDS